MGNFTFSEVITIVIVILIVFGPHRLPEIARKAGQWASKARAALDSVKSELDAEFGEVVQPLKEARDEMRSAGSELKGQITAFGKELEQTGRDVKRAADGAVNEPIQNLKAAADKAVNQVAASNASPPAQPEQTNGEVATPASEEPDAATAEQTAEADGG